MTYTRIAQLKSVDQLREHVDRLNIDLPWDEVVEHGATAPLAKPLHLDGRTIGNRFTILPMEGWDGTEDGKPTELTRRRWKRFGRSGAKWIWGGEAVAVAGEGRANPCQLLLNDDTVDDIGRLRETLVEEHVAAVGDASDLFVGLQLTHSGRFSCPTRHGEREPRIAYQHPFLDERFQADRSCLISDDELRQLVHQCVSAAQLAAHAGFEFIDIKHCHGYLGHELLSAVDRPGDYGGSFENRTRFLREIVAGIRRETESLEIGVRISAADLAPFEKGPGGVGQIAAFEKDNYPYAFGGDGTGTGFDLTEPVRFLDLLQQLGVNLVCITLGSPYYNPHIQRPALFPPSDGYAPPEDPLVGVARQIQVTAALKEQCPQIVLVGSGYSYLQQWLPHVAQAVVRTGMVDSVGLGRLALSYPDFPADVLAGKPLQHKRLCRTFSDCTSAPRAGMVSGCYPLDSYYRTRPEWDKLKAIKKSL